MSYFVFFVEALLLYSYFSALRFLYIVSNKAPWKENVSEYLPWVNLFVNKQTKNVGTSAILKSEFLRWVGLVVKNHAILKHFYFFFKTIPYIKVYF